MSLAKFIWATLPLFFFAFPAPAQSISSRTDPTEDNGGNTEILVEDAAGAAVTGAEVNVAGIDFPFTTNVDGLVTIPGRFLRGILSILEVKAAGFMSLKVQIPGNYSSRYKITLDHSAPLPPGKLIVDASELIADKGKKSKRLQKEAARALAAHEYDKAEDLLKKAGALTPSSYAINNNLGIIAFHNNQLDAAGRWFEKALTFAPDKAEINGNLGVVRWMQNRREDSYTLLSKAVSIGYKSDMAYYILGILALEKGKSTEAMKFLRKANPDRFPFRNLFLSFALRNCGKEDEATESYRSFVRRNPASLLRSD